METTKPLLSDVIAAVEYHIKSYASYEVDYNIEIKSSPAGDKKSHPPVEEFSDLVYKLLDEYLPLERVVIQSFDFRVLRYWHKKYPHVRLSALVENTKSIESNLDALGFKPHVYSPYFKLLSRDKVQYLHAQRIRVIPWTVNEVSDMLSLKGMGVDGFITDYPDRARKYKMTLNIQRP
jgi:glycerophosphoryl diester phosphodiesterase